ncbi:MAG: hypothetical protein AAF493_02210 [Pseudomonadota bacterium]
MSSSPSEPLSNPGRNHRAGIERDAGSKSRLALERRVGEILLVSVGANDAIDLTQRFGSKIERETPTLVTSVNPAIGGSAMTVVPGPQPGGEKLAAGYRLVRGQVLTRYPIRRTR